MAKLININVTEAKGVICVWREDTLGEKCDFEYGIASESSLGNFMIPRYVLVGVFDDGTTKAAGVHNLNQLNLPGDENLFLYDEFLHYVDIFSAKAIVRGLVSDGDYRDEPSAKEGMFAELTRSGVEMSRETIEYLTEGASNRSD